MRVLLAGIGTIAPFAPAWVQALRALQIHVCFVETQELYSPWPLDRIEHSHLIGPAISRIRRAVLRAASQFRPDVILLHNGNPFSSETVQELRSYAWVSGYHHDDPFGNLGSRAYFRFFKASIHHYDSHHVVRPENLAEYAAAGVERVALLNRYYVPWIHYPRTPARQIPAVVFAGHVEEDSRIAHIASLLTANLPLSLFGSPEWPRSLPTPLGKALAKVRPLVGDEYATVLSSARICLAFHSTANRDRDSYRVFEIPACGGFLLAYRTDLVQDLYKEGNEAEFFSTPDELLDKTQYYLRNESARLEIAKRGYDRCLRSNYDIFSRMKQWTKDMQQHIGYRS